MSELDITKVACHNLDSTSLPREGWGFESLGMIEIRSIGVSIIYLLEVRNLLG